MSVLQQKGGFVDNKSLIAVVVIFSAVTALRHFLTPFIGDHLAFLSYLVIVAFSTWRIAPWAGLLTILAGALFFSPHGSAATDQFQYAVGLLIFVTLGASALYLTHALRSARKDIEAHHREIEDALKEADQKKDVFLAVLAHELLNPLSTIDAAATLLDVSDSTPQQKQIKATLKRQIRQAARLVGEVSDISRIKQGKLRLSKENFDLRDVLQEASETEEPLLTEHRHHFSLLLPEEPIPIDGDPLRIQQMANNLITNAIKFTPDAGEISVSAWKEPETREAIIEVKDNGIGIPRKDFPLVIQSEHPAEDSKYAEGVESDVVDVFMLARY